MGESRSRLVVVSGLAGMALGAACAVLLTCALRSASRRYASRGPLRLSLRSGSDGAVGLGSGAGGIAGGIAVGPSAVGSSAIGGEEGEQSSFAVTRLSDDPPIALVRGFMTHRECDQLIARAEALGFSPSTVQEGSTEPSADRTSTTCIFRAGESALIRRIEERVAALTGETVRKVEALQVTKYAPGQFYRPHYDWFPPHALRPVRRLGQRSATVFVYLNDVPSGDGGHTHFPAIGLRVRPEKGAALWWNNTLRDGSTDDRTLHQGTEVRGTKYGLNCWIRFRNWPGR